MRSPTAHPDGGASRIGYPTVRTADLVFKIILPVLMIGIVTAAAHRWGPAFGGVLGAVPAKGGPILLFLAIEQALRSRRRPR